MIHQYRRFPHKTVVNSMARASSTADILFFIVRHLLTVSMRVAFLLFLIIHHSRPKCHWQVCPEMTRLYGQYGTRGRKAARGRLLWDA